MADALLIVAFGLSPFALLLSSIPGVASAIFAIRGSKNPGACTGLVGLGVIFALLIGYGAPLILTADNGGVYGLTLMARMFFGNLIGALILGAASLYGYWRTKNNGYRMVAASIFVAAALIPVAWFTITKSVLKLLHIKMLS